MSETTEDRIRQVKSNLAGLKLKYGLSSITNMAVLSWLIDYIDIVGPPLTETIIERAYAFYGKKGEPVKHILTPSEWDELVKLMGILRYGDKVDQIIFKDALFVNEYDRLMQLRSLKLTEVGKDD